MDPPVLLRIMVKELVSKSDEEIANHLKTVRLNSQALEVHVTSKDDAVSQPVAVYYGGLQGGCQAGDEMHQSFHILSVCKACILENRELECTFKCTSCWDGKRVYRECAAVGLKEWHPVSRPCLPCHNKKVECKKTPATWLVYRLRIQAEGFLRAVIFSLSSDVPIAYARSSPQHQICPICYNLVLGFYQDNSLVNLRMLLVVRRDSNPTVSSPMKKAVTLKALKNKDSMSVETAVEVLSHEVQRAIPTDDVVTTNVPEIYTFWRQNRPGILACSVDAAVHQPTGTIFFSD